MATFQGHEYAFSNQENAYLVAKTHGGLRLFQNAGKAPAFSTYDGKIVGYVSKAADEFLCSNSGDNNALQECDIADMSRDGGKPVKTLLLRGKPANEKATFKF